MRIIPFSGRVPIGQVVLFHDNKKVKKLFLMLFHEAIHASSCHPSGTRSSQNGLIDILTSTVNSNWLWLDFREN